MKYEIGTERPENFAASWEGQFQSFSHLEFVCGIPQLLFAVTTYKENGKPNICFHSWSCFQGDKGGYYAILTGLGTYTHTATNIKRTGEFGINFLSQKYFQNLINTIEGNKEDADEFEAGGFTLRKASHINVPLIEESFLSMECKSEQIMDISGAGVSEMIIGKVINAVIDEEYAKGIDKKYSEEGFMINVHSPRVLSTGKEDQMGVAVLKVERRI